MTQATAYSTVKQALVTLLEARQGLSGVKVSYGPPVNIPDIRSINGSWENIHFLGVDGGTFDEIVFCDGGLRFDEDYVQEVRIQVLRPTNIGTQKACDERVGELLYELLAELAGQHDWDLASLSLDHLNYLMVLPATQEWDVGRLEGTAGHAAGIKLGLQVRARRSFP